MSLEQGKIETKAFLDIYFHPFNTNIQTFIRSRLKGLIPDYYRQFSKYPNWSAISQNITA